MNSPDRTTPDRRPARPRVARGFSFVELLFATLLLGIGFILISAMFPVAVTQARSTQDETAAASLARQAFDVLRELGSNSLLPPTTDQVVSLRAPQRVGGPGPSNNPTWLTIKPQMIANTDPRYAWVPMYRRAANAPFAQAIVIVARATDTQTFNATADLLGPTASDAVNLQPRPIRIWVTNNYDGLGNDSLTIVDGSVAAAGEGAFVILANDNRCYGTNATVVAANVGRLNAKVFKLGRQINSGTWELAPGFDFEPLPDPDGTGAGNEQVAINAIPAIGSDTADAFILGRAFRGGSFVGGVQDLAVYTTLIPVN